MANGDEWYESGVSTNQQGMILRWAHVSTAIPSGAIPAYQDQAPIMVQTLWNEGLGLVTTLVVTGMVGRVVIARDVDGSNRAVLEAEHRRIVKLIETQGLSAVRWS